MCSKGIKICAYNQIFNHDLLKDYSALQSGMDHFVLIINGDFEVITNRNSLTEKFREILNSSSFVKEIKNFLDDVYPKNDHLLRDLVGRLNREITEHKEDEVLQNHDLTQKSLQLERHRFSILDVECLHDKWFVEPDVGEEHFIGALYTLFAHVILPTHPLYHYWKRPLTFSGRGIDAMAIDNEEKGFESDNLLLIEYKYFFAVDEEFNHPLSLVNVIICWDFNSKVQVNDSITDIYDYIGYITDNITENSPDGNPVHIGFKIGKIRKQSMNRHKGNEVTVLSLKRMLQTSFIMESIAPSNSNFNKTSKKQRKRNKR